MWRSSSCGGTFRCFDLTFDMNCEVSFFASNIASQVTLGNRKDIASYPWSLSETEKTSKATLRVTFWGQKLVEIIIRAPLGCFRSPGGEIVDSTREILEKISTSAPLPLSIVFSTFYFHFVPFSSLPPRDRACPPRRTPPIESRASAPA